MLKTACPLTVLCFPADMSETIIDAHCFFILSTQNRLERYACMLDFARNPAPKPIVI